MKRIVPIFATGVVLLLPTGVQARTLTLMSAGAIDRQYNVDVLSLPRRDIRIRWCEWAVRPSRVRCFGKAYAVFILGNRAEWWYWQDLVITHGRNLQVLAGPAE